MLKFSGEFSRFFFLYLVLYVGFSVNGFNGQTTEFNLGTLTLSNLKLLGDAHMFNGSVLLTRDLAVPNSGAGRVLFSKPIRFRQAETHFPITFSTFFSFSVSNLNPSSIGGGLAFVISTDDDIVGDAGGFLGLGEELGPLSGFVAVEFDTLMDAQFKDINGNHVGLDLNSLISSQVGDLDAINVDLKSGDLVNAWVDYVGTTRMFNISVSYSNLRPKEPLMSFNLDLDQFVNDFMFVGFSGSTQGSTEIHRIEWWSFSSSFSDESSSLSESVPPPPPLLNFMTPMANFTNPSPPSSSPSDSNSQNTQKINKSSCHNQFCKREPGAVAGVVTAGAFFLVFFACFLVWLYSKKFKSVKKTEFLTSEIIKTPKEFSYRELKLATRGFDVARIIGHGAFGTVYKGIIPNTGALIAVKRCSHGGSQGKAEFLSELSIIGTLRHRNLVKLQGWCYEKDEILLIYDYMPNGSLDKALFEARAVLPWQNRQRILMGVASALAYLHQECENQVIHRDVKSSNIMLDESFNGRLGDFGLAKQIEHDKSPDATVTAGTMGYLAPEYLLTGRVSEKTDVFSYGAVVLEVASGRRPIERESSGVCRERMCSNLVEWVWSLHREGRLLMAADKRLGDEFNEEEMIRVLSVGLACSHPDPLSRPAMRGVVQMLIGEAEVPIIPRKKPSLSFSTSQLLLSLQDSVSDCNGMITISSSSSSDHSFDGVRLL